MTADIQQKPRVLIVEDEPLIALDLEELLTDANFEICGIASTVVSALHYIDSRSFDVAIVDANLRGVSAAPVAEALQARHLPFAVMSGYSIDQQSQALRQAVLLTKPADPARIIHTLRALLPVR